MLTQEVLGSITFVLNGSWQSGMGCQRASSGHRASEAVVLGLECVFRPVGLLPLG